MTQVPEVWAIGQAYRRVHSLLGLQSAPISDSQIAEIMISQKYADASERASTTATLELARMIEKYEPELAPVDPDVLAVREILAAAYGADGSTRVSDFYRDGSYDKGPSFLAALAAYRRVKSNA